MHALTRADGRAGPTFGAAALGAAALAVVLAGCDGGDGDHVLDPGSSAAAKVAGVNLDVSGQLPEATLDELAAAGVGWIALVPFGWQPRFDVPEIRLRTTGGRWGQTDDGLREIARRAGARGLRTLLKPHIQLVDEVPGQWRGTIAFATQAEWAAWEADYRAFLLHYAQLAADIDADMLCVGVELQRAVGARPAFWRGLIDAVRQVYAGPLTYGANWDGEAAAVAFWDRLDYIGVHAYFPLTGRLDASVDQLERGWEEHRRLLESLCRTWDRPVLFTEVGYRSIAGAAVEPWNYAVTGVADAQEQADAYEALFRALWPRDWFAGLFLWEWDADIHAGDLTPAADYSPQNKPAEAVMARWFTGRG